MPCYDPRDREAGEGATDRCCRLFAALEEAGILDNYISIQDKVWWHNHKLWDLWRARKIDFDSYQRQKIDL